MAASMYIVVEGEDPGFDIFVNGRHLAIYESDLEQLARSAGVPPLLDFLSADQSQMALLVEEGAGDSALIERLPGSQWFSPEAGLVSVSGILSALEADPHAVGAEAPLVLAELREYQTVLRKTAQRALRWHLAVSFR